MPKAASTTKATFGFNAIIDGTFAAIFHSKLVQAEVTGIDSNTFAQVPANVCYESSPISLEAPSCLGSKKALLTAILAHLGHLR
jgi:hypothetical protein